jgi:hypothetical protein
MQFYIKAIRISKKSNHIVSVDAYAKGAPHGYWVARGFIAQMINQGITFNTRYKRQGAMVTGAKVEVYEEDFLRTVPNGTEKDNLESLPTEYV